MNYTYRTKPRLLCPMATFTAKNFSLLRRVLLLEKHPIHRASAMKKQHPAWLASVFAKSTEKTSGRSVLFAGLCGLLSAIPVFIYYRTIYENAYNFPYEDDFNSALSFISDYTFRNLTPVDKLKLIFSQYNEHRIVFDRLVFLADYWLFGNLNFRHLILIGNLALLLIGFLFGKVAFRSLPINQKLVYLLPVTYSLFLFQFWELSTWSMAALQNLYVIPFAFFSLYNLTRPGRGAFAIACLAAVLATYTSGNGMFSFVAGIPPLLFLKSYRKLVLWVIIGSVTVGFYFLNYIRPPYHPDIVDSLFNHTGRAISYFLSLSGASMGIGRPKLAMLFGVILLVVTLILLGYLWYQKRLTAHLPLLSWLLFLYLTCLSLMASRSGMGVEQAFSPRYGIVVVMLFATQAALAIEVVTKRYLRLGVLTVYLGLALFMYLSPTNQGNRQRIEDRTRQLQYSTAFFTENPANLFLHWGSPGVAEPIFKDTYQKGIFKMPHITFRNLKSTPHSFDSSKLISTNTITADVKPYNTAEFLVFYRSWALVNNGLPKNTIIQLVAQSPTNSYSFDTQKHVWDDVTDHTLGRQYTHPGFSCVLDKKDLKPGHYTLWICLTDGESRLYKQVDMTLDI